MSKEEKNILDTMVKDGVVENTYADPNDTGKFASSPVEGSLGLPENPTSTGDGLYAATVTNKDGTKQQLEYSWDKKAAERADLTYQSSVLEAKANYLNNRQQIESQGQQAQQQSDMISYSENQSADKVGWTGGYVLDTERQMNYLKETIKAQMYGQMELQKYGYDTSLAAARLAYDTNKYDLALEYYNTALSRAFSLAQLTDYYVAPEVTEHLNQYKIASDILNGDVEGDKENAARVIQSVHAWFKDHGVSPAGVKTAAAIAREESKAREDMQLRLSLRESYGLINDHFGKDADTFMSIQDGEDSYNLENGTVKTVNFKQMTGEEILNYIKGDSTGVAKEQYLSRMDQLAYQLELDFTDWLKKEKIISDGGTISKTINMKEKILQYLSSEEMNNKLNEEFGKFDSSNPEVAKLLESWDETIQLPDGSTYKLVFTTKDRYKELYGELLKELGKQPNEGNVIPDMPDRIEPASDYVDLNNRLLGEAKQMEILLGNLTADYGIEHLNDFGGALDNAESNTGQSYAAVFSKLDPNYYYQAKKQIDETLGSTNINIMKEAYNIYQKSKSNQYDWKDIPQEERDIIQKLARYYDAYSKLQDTGDKVKRIRLQLNSKEGGKELIDGDFEGSAAAFGTIGDTLDDGFQLKDVDDMAVAGLEGILVGAVETGAWIWHGIFG